MENADISKFLPDKESAIKNLRMAVLIALVGTVVMVVYRLDMFTSGFYGLMTKVISVVEYLLGGALMGAGFFPSLKAMETVYFQLFGTMEYQGQPLHETQFLLPIKGVITVLAGVFSGFFGLFSLPTSAMRLFADQSELLSAAPGQETPHKSTESED